MWPNQPDPMDPYALQQQMGRGQQMQQMAMQPGGGGWGQVAMSLLGGIMGRRMEDRGAKGLQDYETRQREETIAKRQAFAAALTGGDVEGAIAQAFAIPGMENVGVNLLTERSKPKHVPDALWGKFTPESIAAFTQSNDPSVLKDATGGAPTKGLPVGYRWNAETGAAERIPGIDDYFARQSTRAKGSGPQTIVIGGQERIPLGKTASNNAQGELVGLQRQMAALDAIVPTAADDLTLGNQIANYGRGLQSKLGMDIGDEGRERLGRWTEAKFGIEQMFNQYRKLITGAAASQGEIEMLKKSYLNTSMSPDEFKAGYGQIRETMARDVGYFQELVQAGIPVQDVQGMFAATPFGQQPNPSEAPTSDASLGQAELQGQLSNVRGTAPNAEAPPVPGARKAPDGKWYVQQGGEWFEVEG